MLYDKESIGKFTLGRVVEHRDIFNLDNVSVGHVTGFFLNAFKEVTILVTFPDCGEKPVHPSNLKLLDS